MTQPQTAPSPDAPGKTAGRVPRISLAPLAPEPAAETIGVVSEDSAVAEAVRAALTAATGPVRIAAVTPARGLEDLLAPGIRAVIVDVAPGRGGMARLRRICAVGPAAPVIALIRGRGGDGSEDALTALEAGAAETLTATADGAFNGAELAIALRRARARQRATPAAAPSAHAQPAAGKAQPAPLVLVQEAPDAMVVLDRHGLVAFVNPAAEELLGRSADALVGRPFGLDLGKGGEVTIVQPGGETRIAEVDIVETERGGVPARVATLTDITIRRKLEAALKSAQGGRDAALARSSRFFSRVSHDLRTPLTHIVGFAELLQDARISPDARARDYAGAIHEAGRTMLDMVEDLLSVVDQTAHAAPEPCDLVKLVRNTANFVRAGSGRAGSGQNGRRGPEVAVDAPAERLVARVDLARLQRALYRLVSGIARGGDGAGFLRMSLRRAGQQARLTIRLDGLEGQPVPLPASLDDHDPLVTPADARTGFAAELVRETLAAHRGALQLARDGEQVVAAVLTLPLRG